MSPFEPLGDRARWRVVYELLAPLKPGEVITYDELGKALNLDPNDDRHTIQMAVRRAAQSLLTEDSRALDAVKNAGYVVIPAEAHLDLARRHQKKAGRSLERGHDHVEHVDLNALDEETRKAFHVVAHAFAQQRAVVDRLNVKQKRLEQALDAMAPRVERSESEIAELRERLARLEQQGQ
jgi:hypothetical protein